MIIYVQNKYKPMRKSKKKINASRRPSKVRIIPIESKINPVVSGVVIRETPHYQSLVTTSGSTTKPIQGKVYTGTAMIGIGTLHKSNAVPVFKKEDLEDQAKMRR
jgi:hypothetical protein